METIQVRILQASDGKYLYNGETICRYVQLAPTSDAGDWREITEEEAFIRRTYCIALRFPYTQLSSIEFIEV